MQLSSYEMRNVMGWSEPGGGLVMFISRFPFRIQWKISTDI